MTDKKSASALFDEIHAALAAGHKPPGLHTNSGLNERSALRVACDKLAIPPGSRHSKLGLAIRILGHEPNWALYVPLPRGVRAPKTSTVPMSESTEKQHLDWTAEQCCDELRRVAEIDTTKVISRNYFRNNSEISESTWNHHFGTFAEFKRQSGIVLSRPQHQLERHIAKHASLDNYRDMNVDKANWDEAYLKPTGRRFQTVLVGSDIHDVDCDPFWRFLFIENARRSRPDKIVLNGDLFDLPEFGKYGVDPREWDVVGRIAWVHSFLGDLREVAPDAEIIMVEGNHEFRLMRHLADETPALRAVLSDLHGFTVPKLLGLDKFEVNYVARMDLAAFTAADIKRELARNYHVMYECLLAHHFPEGRRMGYPGFNGHHHTHIVFPGYSPQFNDFEWHQMGAGHVQGATYCDGARWSLGLGNWLVDTETKATQMAYTYIRDTTVMDGKFYSRSECV